MISSLALKWQVFKVEMPVFQQFFKFPKAGLTKMFLGDLNSNIYKSEGCVNFR